MEKQPENRPNFNEVKDQLGSFTVEKVEANDGSDRDGALLKKIAEQDEQIKALQAQADTHHKGLGVVRWLLIGVSIVLFAAFFSTSVALFIHFFETTGRFNETVKSLSDENAKLRMQGIVVRLDTNENRTNRILPHVSKNGKWVRKP